MVKAWLALDRAADAAGALKMSPLVWEVPLEDGSVAALVPDVTHAKYVITEGRQVAVYTIEEVGQLLSKHSAVTRTKLVFPGAEITALRQSVEDPLNEISDTKAGLDDPVDDVC